MSGHYRPLAAAVALYTDGGVLKKNPSPYGGTWAWVAVSATDREVARSSGFRPWTTFDDDRGVSANLMEYIAAVRALEAVPPGWSGTLYTDSDVTLARLTRPVPFVGVPGDWFERARSVLADIGELQVVLLAGHPSRAELERGYSKDGLPVSRWNVEADRMCKQLAKANLQQLEQAG